MMNGEPRCQGQNQHRPAVKGCRIVAFYLPQFHPIPENDAWWGKGFTEWTNVARARPLFRNHYQPRLPADLGFYDLRVPETRSAQADLAEAHGIEAFCYWHYWFASKRLLSRPFADVLSSGKPDFPFCLAWANHSWTGVWQGECDRVLIEQTYPGRADYETHFRAILDAFEDPRYLRIENRPVFVVYEPRALPEPRQFTDQWRELALHSGLKDVYFMGVAGPAWVPEAHGFDAALLNNPGIAFARLNWVSRLTTIARKLYRTDLTALEWSLRTMFTRPRVYLYKTAMKHALPPLAKDRVQYPCAIPSWDNTPRSGVRGVVLHRSTPGLFKEHLTQAIQQISDRPLEQRIVFIKSWNEWAEGNYLEPDQRFGRAYLEVIRECLTSLS
jgi:hypothetical protein